MRLIPLLFTCTSLLAPLAASTGAFANSSDDKAAESMCVDGKRCDARYDSTGVCQLWLTFTVCGPVCVTGNVCDIEYDDGRCADYRVDAQCGERCVRNEVCRLRYDDGRCAETQDEISCQ